MSKKVVHRICCVFCTVHEPTCAHMCTYCVARLFIGSDSLHWPTYTDTDANTVNTQDGGVHPLQADRLIGLGT
jgi:hypothetical protein